MIRGVLFVVLFWIAVILVVLGFKFLHYLFQEHVVLVIVGIAATVFLFMIGHDASYPD